MTAFEYSVQHLPNGQGIILHAQTNCNAKKCTVRSTYIGEVSNVQSGLFR